MEELNQEGKSGELYTIGKLIQDSFLVIRRDFRILLEISLLSAISSLIFGFFVNGQASTTVHHFTHLRSYLLQLLSIAVGLIFTIARIYAINKLSENSSVSLSESFKVAFQKYFPYLLVFILVTLVVFGGILLLIVPGIIFMVWFLFFEYPVILEDRRGTSAMRRSKQLVQGNGWYIFVISFVLCIFYFASAYVSTGVLWGILYPIVRLPLNYQHLFVSSPNQQVFFTLFSVFSAILMIPFEASYVLLFKNLREIKGDSIIAVPYKFRASK